MSCSVYHLFGNEDFIVGIGIIIERVLMVPELHHELDTLLLAVLLLLLSAFTDHHHRC